MNALHGVVVARAGTAHRSDEVEVASHLPTERKKSCLALPEGTLAWEEGASLPESLRAPASR